MYKASIDDVVISQLFEFIASLEQKFDAEFERLWKESEPFAVNN